MRFDPSMSKEAFADELRNCFGHISGFSDAAPNTTDLLTRKTAGKPVSDLELFRAIDNRVAEGLSKLGALNECVAASLTYSLQAEQNPELRETLRRKYYKYRRKLRDGLDPARQHGNSKLFDCILAKQWDLAAAIFCNANKYWRKNWCNKLNSYVAAQ